MKARAAVAVAGGLAALVLLLHAPFVRSAVLRYALASIERQYGLHLNATRLDYNLATLTVGLEGVRLTAQAPIAEPFFEASYLVVTLPRSALLGDLAFRRVAVSEARVTIRRYADGTTNLPRGSDRPSEEPPPLRIARLEAPELAIDLRDQAADVSLQIPNAALLLTADEGYVRLAQPAVLSTAHQKTAITRLDGEASFDGRTLRLAATRIEAPEISLGLDGTLTLITREPAAGIRLQGTGDIGRLARWALQDDLLPRGALMVDARITGKLADPRAELNLTAPAVSWQAISAANVTARMRVSADAADITDARFELNGGRVNATGSLPFATESPGRVVASWTGIDAAATVRMLAPDVAVLPAGAVSGDFQWQGPISSPAGGSATVDLQMVPGRNARGRLAVAGNLTAVLSGGRWSLQGRQAVGGVAPLTVSARGRLPEADRNTPATIDEGELRLAQTGLPDLLAVLRTTGVIDAPDDVLKRGLVNADVKFSGSIADPDLQVNASLANLIGPQIDIPSAQAAVNGRLLEPRLQFTVLAPDATVAGQPLHDVRSAGRLIGSSLSLDELSVAQPTAPGLVSATGTYNLQTGEYAVMVNGRDWQIAATADQPLAGTAAFRFTGAGTLEDPRGAGEITVRGAMVRGASDGATVRGPTDDATVRGPTEGAMVRALGDVTASVQLAGRAAQIEAQAPDFNASADARVQLDEPYPTVIDARATDLDVLRLTGDLKTAIPLRASGTVAIHAEGPLQAWRDGSASVAVLSLEGAAGDLPVRLVEPAQLRYLADRVYVDRLEATAGETRLSASGALPLTAPAPDAPAVLVTITGDVGEVVRAAAATGITDFPVTGGNGPVALLARITGSLEQPDVAADLEVGPGAVTLENLPSVSRVRLRVHAEDGWIELRDGGLSYQDADVSATGRVPLSWFTGDTNITSRAGPSGPAETAVIHAQATNVTPAIVAPFLEATTLDELSGSLDVTVEASSASAQLSDVIGELRIDRFDLRIADLPVTQRMPTRIVARDGFARIETWDWAGQGATLGVRGQVRLADLQAAILANGVVDMRVVTPFVRTAGITTAGRLEPRLSITGRLDDPRIDGDIQVTDGEVRVTDPRILVSDVNLRSVLTRTSAQITSMTGLVNGGPLTGTGRITYTPADGLDARLAATISGMAMEFPQGLRSEIDAALALTADIPAGDNARPSGELSGTVTVLRSTYREPMAIVTGLLAGLRTQQLAASSQSPGFLESLALDVRLVTDEDIIVDNNYGRFQLGGDVRVIGTAAAPALSGRAELREGGRLFIGRNVYAINFGTIDFSNPVAIEPVLNVEAATRAGGEDIEVTISGPAENPTVDLRSSSNPDLGQAELASLLLTGRRLEDLAPGDAAFVGTQVLGNFSGEVLGFASRAVGLDTLRLGGVDTNTSRRESTAVAAELDPTTRLTFGKSLGSNVDVTFSQSLRDSDAQTWIVDYLPKRGVDLRLVSDDNDLRSYGFRHDVAVGGGPATPRAGPAAAPPVARVSEVRVSGDLVLPEARVRQQLHLGSGDRFDFARWQEDRDRLEEWYRREGYLDVRIESTRSEGPDGVALDYRMTAGPRTRIVVTGFDSTAALRSRLEMAWAQSVFEEFLIDEAQEIVRAELARDGYLQAKVSAQVTQEDAARTLTVQADPGPRSTRTEVRIETADEALGVDLRRHMVAAGLIDRAISDATGVEREATAYLRTNGYLRARVKVGAPLFEDSVAIVPVSVDAGPVFRLTGVAFEGVRTLPEDSFRKVVALAPGMPYNPAAVDAARDRLIALLRREGFSTGSVVVRQTVGTSAPTVDAVFAVTEGPRQVVGDIIVTGNRTIDTDVVVRALDLQANAPLRAEDVLRGRTRVFDTGLFRRVDVAPEPRSDPDVRRPGPTDPANVEPVPLRVTVEEWPALRLRYGFEVAEEHPENDLTGRDLVPGLSADLTRRTLFGRAMTVGGAVELQRRERLGRAFAGTPTLFGLPVESSVVGERSREEFTAVTLVTDRAKVTWEQRARITGRFTASYAYTFERNHTFDTKTTDPGALAFDITINIARLNAAAAWDSRDDPADTSRGLLASYSLEFAPEAIGSDIRFVRHLAQAYDFRPWHRLVFASAARLGAVVPLGGQELIVSERFFAGGSRTVRGVVEGGLGPRDFFGDPAGGQMMLVFNHEVRVPIYKWLRGIGFVDAGNVFTRPRDVDFGKLVGSIGVGVRLASPFALLRVDYAKPVHAGSLGPSGRWTFGIGQAF
jgi:outer membrane protein assembly factor BamA/autotransporter translocation and assembly factor TamB